MNPFQFDYNQVDGAFVSRIMNENSLRLSRTRQGRSDTGTSRQKLPLRLEGEALKRRSADNEQRVHQFLYETRGDPAPDSADAVRSLLLTIAERTNEGLLPQSSPLRTWPIHSGQRSVDGASTVCGNESKVDPDDLPKAIAAFCDQVHRRWGGVEAHPVAVASWAEWEINGGRLHPFYDGCGRIARSFGALVLIRAGILLPLYDNTESYFAHGNRGTEAFSDYIRERILDCSRWLATWYGEEGTD